MNKKNQKPPPEAQISLSLLENGLDFILKGMDELFGENHALKNAKATEVELRNYKYGITNLFSGFLLLLKERLSRHFPELIFSGKLSDIKKNLQAGKKIPATVDLDEALERLEIGPRMTFSPDELEVIRRMQDFRNQFEHYRVTGNKYQLWAEVTRFLDVIERFLREELGIVLEKHSKESKLLRKRAEVLRETVVKYDSVLEKEVFEVISRLAGKAIPGRLLGANENMVLPMISPNQEPYTVGDRKYTPDFNGKDGSGVQWLIEVKGSYLRSDGVDVLARLLAIQKQLPKVKTWLIVIGEMSNSAKDFAIQNEIYFTDLVAWQELKSLTN
jgi:hypothetical protein